MFVPSNVLVTVNVGSQLGRRIPVSTHLIGDGSVGEIVLMAAIPDQARICITIDDVTDIAGNVLPTQPVRIVASTLLGDVNGNGIVAPDDQAILGALIGTDPIDPGVFEQLRSDLDRDGKIDAVDLALLSARLGRDLTGVGTSCLSPGPLPR